MIEACIDVKLLLQSERVQQRRIYRIDTQPSSPVRWASQALQPLHALQAHHGPSSLAAARNRRERPRRTCVETLFHKAASQHGA